MDSSPDLSLKLRRGSSDSRDTFYMDFAQGIDSDIEEVDNSGINREPQQPLTPPQLPSAVEDEELKPTQAINMLPPPILHSENILTPLSEHEEMPPTPPAHQSNTSLSSAPVSPTLSVLEIMPPPPLSISPTLETEDESDDVVEAKKDNNDDDDDEQDMDDDSAIPPPPLEPLPTHFSYLHSSGDQEMEFSFVADTSQHKKSPIELPSPPVTPTLGSQLTLSKMVSPPPLPHVSHEKSPTHSSESEQEHPSTPPAPESQYFDGLVSTTPPPGFGADMATAIEDTTLDAVHEILQATSTELPDDGESATITAPPSNENSESSILAPPPEQLDEVNNDVSLSSENIPLDLEMKVKTEKEENTLASSGAPTPTPILEEIAKDDEGENSIVSAQAVEEGQNYVAASESSPPLSVISSKIGNSFAGSVGSQGRSRNISRTGSRTDSRKSSYNGSIHDSSSSKAESIAAAAVASPTQDVTSAKMVSPQASIKSSSPSSIKSALHSKQSSPPAARIQSPSASERAISISSLPSQRSSPNSNRSPLAVHSPPQASSSPKIQSPPVNRAELNTSKELQNADAVNERFQKKESTFEEPNASKQVETPTIGATNTVSFQDEQPLGRPHVRSHHHYHLPHQFQHPHHQNHHTHSVPVPTPTVPASYTSTHVVNETHARNIRETSERSVKNIDTLHFVPSQTPSNLTAPETEQQASVSPSRLSARTRDGSHHRVTIDESNLPALFSTTNHFEGSGSGAPNSSGAPSPSSSSNHDLATIGVDRQSDHLALMYHSSQLSNLPVLPAIKRHRPSFIYPPMPRVKAGDALATLLSALYGKILVVMGIAFPMAEVISTYIPPSFYEVYYLYLYIGSMIFLLFMYATLLWGRPKIPKTFTSPIKSTKHRSTSASEMDESDTDSTSAHNKHVPSLSTAARRPSLLSPLGRQHHYGSFYLRMGAVAFGIGSMIYSGLEFGQYFELNPDTKCHNVLLALTPATRMAFIFIQMYFIFLNNEQIKVYRYKIIARFGLMHMIGTNLAVWLNVLIQETKHEILTFYNTENRTLRISHRIPGHSRGHAVIAPESTPHLRVARGLKGPYQIFECRRTNIIGTLVQDASPFLFPCTIEYSLICAAILYVMWRSISRPNTTPPQRPDTITSPIKRSPHHYSVDCARAHKGLFVGILILVLTIISLILFFVLISRPDFVALAVTEVTICELLIYGTATIATLIGMIQVRHLQYDAYRSFSLDDILLVGAQTGSFLYNIFTVIAGHFTIRSDDMLVPINALASMVQTACQTMFILDASRRQAVTPEHIRKKPGREIVTFMLVVNLAMWAISTLEKSRAESHPIQLNFYGLWAWTIITHVSMPLAIFYRFHSTVCLCEIWKRAYKLKPAYM